MTACPLMIVCEFCPLSLPLTSHLVRDPVTLSLPSQGTEMFSFPTAESEALGNLQLPRCAELLLSFRPGAARTSSHAKTPPSRLSFPKGM